MSRLLTGWAGPPPFFPPPRGAGAPRALGPAVRVGAGPVDVPFTTILISRSQLLIWGFIFYRSYVWFGFGLFKGFVFGLWDDDVLGVREGRTQLPEVPAAAGLGSPRLSLGLQKAPHIVPVIPAPSTSMSHGSPSIWHLRPAPGHFPDCLGLGPSWRRQRGWPQTTGCPPCTEHTWERAPGRQRVPSTEPIERPAEVSQLPLGWPRGWPRAGPAQQPAGLSGGHSSGPPGPHASTWKP